eukprot:tig00000615_g2596.t2
MSTLEVIGIGSIRAVLVADGWVVSAQDVVAAVKGVEPDRVSPIKLKKKIEKLHLRVRPMHDGPSLAYGDMLSLLSHEISKRKSPRDELIELSNRLRTNEAAAFFTRGLRSPPNGFRLHERPASEVDGESSGGFFACFRSAPTDIVPTPMPPRGASPAPASTSAPGPLPSVRSMRGTPLSIPEDPSVGIFAGLWASIASLFGSSGSVIGDARLGSVVRAVVPQGASVQWYRLRKGGRYAIPGATEASYAVRAEDMGAELEADIRGEKREAARVGPVPWEDAVVAKVQKYWEKGKMLFVQFVLVEEGRAARPVEIKLVRYVFVRIASETRDVQSDLKAEYENTRIVEVPPREGGLRDVILQLGGQRLRLRARTVEEREIFVAAWRIFANHRCPLTETDRYIADTLVHGPARAAEYAAKHAHEVPLRAGGFVAGAAQSAVQAPFRAIKKGYEVQKEAAERYGYLGEDKKKGKKAKAPKKKEEYGDPPKFPSMGEISGGTA